MILHLGVIDLPYQEFVPSGKKKMRKGVTAPAGGQTTGDVAEFLEHKYKVMGHFFEKHGQAIVDELSEALLDNVADLAAGRNIEAPNMTAATSKIHEMFMGFIDRREMDGVVGGVPTLAARKGISHRFLHPYARSNPERPSFRDTGTYAGAFRAWLGQ